MIIPAEFVSGLGNHLWQSTLFSGLAALLALALKKNHARTRYWIWMAASVKFLVPFSLLVAMGNRVEWTAARPAVQPAFSMVMKQITQPFPSVQTAPIVAAPTVVYSANVIPVILLLVWMCGLIAVACSWLVRWLRVRRVVRAAVPLSFDLEVPVLSSQALLEPGVFGVFRPVLLLPQGITDHLAPEHLRAILAHELCHIRRRDNLASAIHMAVEAAFWFHPLVWWVGARLVEEREHACDEEVLRLGNQPEIYAESILKTCQFYLESPLACMSGISGADLKKRVVRIMSQRLALQLSLSRKLLLAVAGVAALAGPIVLGLMNAPASRAQSQPRPSFEVATIKLNKSGDGRIMLMNKPGGRFSATNITLKALIEFAYDLKDTQLSGATGWMTSENYDIEAKAEAPAGGESKLRPEDEMEQRKLMLQSLLADRFKLTLRHETKDLPIYTLVVAKNGPKLHELAETKTDGPPPPPPPSEGGPGPEPGAPKRRMAMIGRGEFTMTDAPLSLLTDALSHQVGRSVIDKTGLTGKYDVALKWTPDENEGHMFHGPGDGDRKLSRDSAPPPDSSGPSIFTALQEQLGLKLESHKGPVDTVTIEHVERPSEN